MKIKIKINIKIKIKIKIKTGKKLKMFCKKLEKFSYRSKKQY